MEYKARTLKLKDDTEVLIKPVADEDFEKSLQFFKDLSEEDRLYLRVDVTDPEVVKLRLKTGELENTFRIVALKDDRIIGDAVLEWPGYGWMSHVGEMRSITSRDFRRRGLATVLYRQLFIQAIREGLEKVEAKMMPNQETAIRCVEKLGFKEEGRLPGFVLDVAGKVHDLVVMSTNLEGWELPTS